ncbi:MAG: hypothetical protein ACE5F1_02145 [Planctomycetota bacterium]
MDRRDEPTVDTSEEQRTAPGVRAQLALLLGLVFASGLLSGMLAPRLFAVPETTPESRSQHFVEHFAKEFDLSPQQIGLLRMILEQRDRLKASLWEGPFIERLSPEDRERLEEVRTKADLRIWAMLEPEQRSKYERMLK